MGPDGHPTPTSQLAITVANYPPRPHSLSDSQTANRLGTFLIDWKLLTSDKWTLQAVTGYKIPFLRTPRQWRPRPTVTKAGQQSELMRESIQSLISKGATTVVAPHPQQFISTLFLVEKGQGTGEFRPVSNLRALNRFLPKERFKMEGLHTARPLLRSGDYMMKLDLKDAYYAVSIHQDSRKYLRFQFEGTTFEFRCLSFGLSLPPRVFTRISRPVVAKLRSEGVRTVIYLDDLLLIHHQKETLIEIFYYVQKLLSSLGFVVKREKCSPAPHPSARFPRCSIGYQSDVFGSSRGADRSHSDSMSADTRDWVSYTGGAGKLTGPHESCSQDRSMGGPFSLQSLTTSAGLSTPPGRLEYGRAGAAHQLLGTQSGVSYVEIISGSRGSGSNSLLGPAPSTSYSAGNGQHNSGCGCGCEQERGNAVPHTLSPSLGPVVFSSGKGLMGQSPSPTVTGRVECRSTCSLEGVQCAYRMDASEGCFQAHNSSLLSSTDRPLCISPKPPGAPLRVPPPRSGGISSGRFSSGLESMEEFHPSTSGTSASHSSESDGRQGFSLAGSPRLAGAAVVRSDPADANGGALSPSQGENTAIAALRPGGNSSTVAVAQPDCMADIGKAYQAAGFPAEMTSILLASWSQSSQKRYQGPWRVWC